MMDACDTKIYKICKKFIVPVEGMHFSMFKNGEYDVLPYTNLPYASLP